MHLYGDTEINRSVDIKDISEQQQIEPILIIIEKKGNVDDVSA